MEITPISTNLAPSKSAITSQAILSGGLVFTAGVMPLDVESQSLPSGGVGPETHLAMRNLSAILAAAGSSLDGLVQVTIYLRNWADFAEMNAVYVSYLNPPYPARACISGQKRATSGTTPRWRLSRLHSPKLKEGETSRPHYPRRLSRAVHPPYGGRLLMSTI